MLLRIHPETPSHRQVQKAVEVLLRDGVIIYPTDTIYAMGCNIFSPKAIDRISRIKGINTKTANYSVLCHDMSQLSDYSRPISNDVYKLMRRTLPGPFTFILNASSNVPKIFHNKKKTVGIRIPANNIVSEIIKELGNPIVSTSIHDEDDIIEYSTDPELIHEKYDHLVDMVIDGGIGGNVPSTVIDCTGEEILLIREGKGVIE
jgi:tRNA threonylcarbamoyl adenosine modification protein (Sua5/YciO/YrdC/YwlC family)